MSSREIILTSQVATPPPMFSQAVKAAGLIFVSGTTPMDAKSGAFKGHTIQEQTHQVMRNISAILRAAGSSLEKVVSATVILDDGADFDGMNEEWLKWFPSKPPARQVTQLSVKIEGLKVSIACIALA